MITMSSQRPSGSQNFGPHQMGYSPEDGISVGEVMVRQQQLLLLQLEQQHQQQQQQAIQQSQHQQQIYLNMLAASMATTTTSDINVIPPTPLSDDSHVYSFAHPIPRPQSQPQHQTSVLTFIQPPDSVPSPHSPPSLQSMTGASSPHSGMALSRSLTPSPAFESNQQQQQQSQELFAVVTGCNNFQQEPHHQLLGLPLNDSNQHHHHATQSHYFTMDTMFKCEPTSPAPSFATTATHLSDDGSVIATTTNISPQMSYSNVIPLSIYEPEPVSPLTAIPSDPQTLAINMPSSAIISVQPPQPDPPQSHSPSLIHTSASSSSSPRALDVAQISLYSSAESVGGDSGDLVRRSHSDVTELSATTIRRFQEESDIYPRPSTTPSSSHSQPSSLSDPSSRVTKRSTSRSSLPSREGKLPCTICKKWFKKLDDHLWTHSPEPRPHKCRAGYTDGRPTCQYVTMGFARVADRNRHELKHYDGRFVCPFGITNCRIGNERFGRLDTFKRHLRTVHGVSQTAVAAGSSTSSNGTPQHSSATHSSHPAGSHKRHRTRKLSTSDKQLECYNCNKAYYGVEAFIGHLNDCTYALMHPGEADGSADVGYDDSE
ncbi:hypothetical protein V1525DRAFT_394109 [Lipomyces kononenkoae]|uniref:Uncharacterized protein n=1 Tax=Lipomyces kononenkoae TaxID=34357 RepID=A0ACC3TA92_LIPKO